MLYLLIVLTIEPLPPFPWGRVFPFGVRGIGAWTPCYRRGVPRNAGHDVWYQFMAVLFRTAGYNLGHTALEIFCKQSICAYRSICVQISLTKLNTAIFPFFALKFSPIKFWSKKIATNEYWDYSEFWRNENFFGFCSDLLSFLAWTGDLFRCAIQPHRVHWEEPFSKLANTSLLQLGQFNLTPE